MYSIVGMVKEQMMEIKEKAEYVKKTLEHIDSDTANRQMVLAALNYIRDKSVTDYLERQGDSIVRTYGGTLSTWLHNNP